jgi:hypothetical protein
MKAFRVHNSGEVKGLGGRRWRSATIVLFAVLGTLHAADYYISSSGNDNNTGTGSAPTAAWATVAKVNATSFKPGDRILFEGGKTFTGTIQLGNTGTCQ